MEVFWVVSEASAPGDAGYECPIQRDSSQLEIRCFGRFEIYRSGEMLHPDLFKRKSALLLLKVLLLAAGNPVSSDAACDLLWPGSESPVARNRLHGAVHALRQAIEPGATGQRWLYVCGRGDHYCFNLASPHHIDFLEFRRLLSQARALERAGRPLEEVLDTLEKADHICRGDLFGDDPYAEWCLAERRALRESHLEVLCSLARLWSARGEIRRSVEYLRRVLQMDPLREDVHQTLMEALWTLGRRQDALLQYEVCASTLQRRLGAELLPETKALYRRIMASMK